MSSQVPPSQLEVIHVVPRPDELNMTQSPGSYNVTMVTGMVTGGVTANQVTAALDVTTITEAPVSLEHCLWVLYAEFGTSNVRIWDVALLVPNSLFLLFLIFKGKIAVAKLQQTSSAVFFAFYAMVLTVAIISVARAVVSMMVNASTSSGDITDTVLWIIVKFFLISIELSVIIFGLCSSIVDSKIIIKRILMVTSTIALAYSVTQGVLEIMFPDKHFVAPDKYDIYAHGGMIFWCISSAVFALAYFTVLILPCTRIKYVIQLPVRKSFYGYVAFLALLNLIQAVASGLVYKGAKPAICAVDVTSYVYFSIFAPLIYLTFLHKFFRKCKQPLLLSYNNPADEAEDEAHHLPHSYSTNSKEEPISISPAMYNSTEFGQSPNVTFGPLVIGNPMDQSTIQAGLPVNQQPSINYSE